MNQKNEVDCSMLLKLANTTQLVSCRRELDYLNIYKGRSRDDLRAI